MATENQDYQAEQAAIEESYALNDTRIQRLGSLELTSLDHDDTIGHDDRPADLENTRGHDEKGHRKGYKKNKRHGHEDDAYPGGVVDNTPRHDMEDPDMVDREEDVSSLQQGSEFLESMPRF